MSDSSQPRWDTEKQREPAGTRSHYPRIICSQPTALELKDREIDPQVSSAVLHRCFFHSCGRAGQYHQSPQSPVAATSFIPSSSAGSGRAAAYFTANSWTAKTVTAVTGQLGERGGRLTAVVESGLSQQHLLPVLLLVFPRHQQNQQI